MKYLTLHETTAAYEAVKDSLELPHVALTLDDNAVHYQPLVAPSHEYVDLGLPSGTLWATCNVGADTPESYGDYFAWGETEPKTTYDWSTYKYCVGEYDRLTKYCSDTTYGYNGFTDDLYVLQPSDDAATVNWGEGWRTPKVRKLWNCWTNAIIDGIRLMGLAGCLLSGKMAIRFSCLLRGLKEFSLMMKDPKPNSIKRATVASIG